MQPGYSIQLVWPLASVEAVCMDYAQIEPEHFFNSLLKFVEQHETSLAQLVREKRYLEDLIKEQETVRAVIGSWGLVIPDDTTTLRRGLRQKMGRGNYKHERQNIVHRSEISRRLCQRAEEIATNEGASSWQSFHLLAALLEEPQGHLAEVLKNTGAVKLELVKTPLLDLYGSKVESAKTYNKNDQSVDPAVRVVKEAIDQETRRSLALIEKGGLSPYDVICTVVALLDAEGRRKKFIMVNLSDIKTAAARKPGLLSNLLAEASRINVILCIEGLGNALEISGEKFNVTSLAKALENEQLCCICILDEATYNSLLKTQAWVRLLQPVWLQPRPELPW